MSCSTKMVRDVLLAPSDTTGAEALKYDNGKPKLSLLDPDMLVCLMPADTHRDIVAIARQVCFVGHCGEINSITFQCASAIAKIRDFIGSEHAIKFCCMGLEYGMQKYHKNNWKTGFTWSRLIDAALRHIVLGVAQGEDIDPESGNPHWGHALCMLMFLQHGLDCHEDKNDIF